MKAQGTGHAAGKVILLGEHAVVHGEPAVAVGLGQCVTVTATQTDGPTTLRVPLWDWTARVGGAEIGDRALAAIFQSLGVAPVGICLVGSSRIPSRAGLGASAAVAAACARAIAEIMELTPTLEALFNAVQGAERHFHGNPSGLDAAAVLTPGMIEFSQKNGPRLLSGQLPQLVIAYSGEGGDTRQMVDLFAAKLAHLPAEGRANLSAIGAITRRAVIALQNGDMPLLGTLMDENHRLLSWFQMSTPSLDRICRAAKIGGALGAKLTGGGGGGCAVALVNDACRESVEQAICGEGFQLVVIE